MKNENNDFKVNLLTLEWRTLRLVFPNLKVQSVGKLVTINESGYLYNSKNSYPVGKLTENNVLHLRRALDSYKILEHDIWIIRLNDDNEEAAYQFLNTDMRYLLYDFFMINVKGDISDKCFTTKRFSDSLGIGKEQANMILKHLEGLDYVRSKGSRKIFTDKGLIYMKHE